MNRYKPVGNWRPGNGEIVIVYPPDQRYAQYVNIDVSDVREDGGQIWHNGAHRVTVTRPPFVDRAGIPRSKTFIGEMAWAQAARYAEDAIASIRKAIEGR